MTREAKFLIKKQGYWYRPDECGYTSSAIQAGRYTYDDAVKITHPNGPDGPRDGMSFISEDIVPCEDWQAFRALTAKLAQVEAERDALASQLAEARAALDKTVEAGDIMALDASQFHSAMWSDIRAALAKTEGGE